ncbi:glycosyltransferase family 4 protein [Enterobacter sp.]|uniref:glycosyltransferase family 4 protein n=1 Tax=Enterobacter sp. TaxID=42895 RepID=UPI0029821801|nr:glycosyltransferase family 4 protein [Enterobacter sp.]
MNVLYILNKAVMSGPNIVALSNAEKLYFSGLKVFIVFLKGGADLSTEFPFLREIEVIELDSSNSWGKLNYLNKFVRENRMDVIHSHCFYPDLFNVLLKITTRLENKKHLSTVHNIPSQDYIIRYGYLKGNALLAIHKLLLSVLDMCVCISKTVQDRLKIKDTTVIYNPVRDVFFNNNKIKPKLLRIVYCGHFSELKNPLNIITLLSNITTDFKFTGLGDGPILQQCKDKVAGDHRFNFLGRVNNVADYYGQANCLIHFSQTEGFCLSVAEALASSMYVITNDLPIFYELKDALDADNFFILKKLDEDNVYSVLNVISKKLSQHDNDAYEVSERAESLLSSQVTSEKHLCLYNNLLLKHQ